MPYGYFGVAPLLLFILFLAARIRLELVYCTCPQEEFALRLGLLWQVRRCQIRLPFYTWRPGAGGGQPSARLGGRWWGARVRLADTRFLLRLAAGLLQRLELEAEGWIRFGTGDAATTGFASGLIWSGLGLAQALAQQVLRRSRIRIQLEPEFARGCLEVDLKCIAAVPVTHIISVAARALTYLWQEQAERKRRGGKEGWPNILFRAS